MKSLFFTFKTRRVKILKKKKERKHWSGGLKKKKTVKT